MLSILNQRGGTHNSCEDSVWVEESEKFIIGGIFDGCSTGINSHWASQTLAYAFKSIVKRELFTIPRQLSNDAVHFILYSLNGIANILKIDPYTELLSTCFIFCYDKELKTLEVRCFGDGVYYVNDIEYVIDQGNIPDYLGYYVTEGFNKQQEFINKYSPVTHNNVDRFIICSDGIQAIKENQFEQADVTWQQLLLSPPKSENYLKRMWNILKNKKFTLGDDLTIVSYANS
jgi:hypothetical protein